MVEWRGGEMAGWWNGGEEWRNGVEEGWNGVKEWCHGGVEGW